MTTYSEFVSGLAALVVDDVRLRLVAPPVTLSAADLPAQWIQFPRADERPVVFFHSGDWPILRADLVVAVVAVADGRQDENFTATLAMMDAVSDALSTANVCLSQLSWRIRQDVVMVAETAYWAVVAEVEGSG